MSVNNHSKPTPPSYAHVTQYHQPQPWQQTRYQRRQQRPGQGSRRRRKPSTLIVGTSLTEGLSAELQDRGVDATTFMYRGGKLSQIRQRVPHIFKSSRPDKIVLQAGGNDAEATTVDLTINEYVGLVRDVKRLCPQSEILISAIPPRKNNQTINRKINEVNSYLKELRIENVKFINVAPTNQNMFTNKKVHYNRKGKSQFARNLRPYLID